MANEKKEDAKKKVKRPTALKRNIQNEAKRKHKRAFKARVRTAMNALDAASGDEVKAAFVNVQSLMDKGVKKGVYNLNRASRVKARLSKKLSV